MPRWRTPTRQLRRLADDRPLQPARGVAVEEGADAAAAALLVAREQHADRPRDRAGRQRLQDRGDRALGVGGAEAVQPIAPPHQQVRRRRVALVGGDGVDVGVQQQARRAGAEARVDVGVVADRRPPRPTRRPARAARRASRCTSGRSSPSGLRVSNETSSASRSTKRSVVAIGRGLYNVCGPCRPPPSPSSRSCSPRRGPSPRAPLPPRPHIAATRTAQPPVIDGRLDDAVWAAAAPSDAFVQHFPDEGAPPSERTTVRVLYDDRNLYVGIDCEQLNAPIVRRLARRDSQIPSDGVWIDIDSRRAGVGAFHFAVNAAGMLSDGIHFDDTAYSSDWDAVWEAKVADTDRGYAVEFRIPLSVLRFSALPVQDWGFQVRRFIDARQETDDWAFYPRSAATLVPLFGRLDGLRDLAPRHAIELRPFVLGRARLPRRRRRRDAGQTAGRRAASAGLDARAHVTNELTLDVDAQPRLRPGRGRHRRPEPVDVRDVLPREAAVLPGRDRRVRDRAAAGLHAPHRAASP